MAALSMENFALIKIRLDTLLLKAEFEAWALPFEAFALHRSAFEAKVLFVAQALNATFQAPGNQILASYAFYLDTAWAL